MPRNLHDCSIIKPTFLQTLDSSAVEEIVQFEISLQFCNYQRRNCDLCYNKFYYVSKFCWSSIISWPIESGNCVSSHTLGQLQRRGGTLWRAEGVIRKPCYMTFCMTDMPFATFWGDTLLSKWPSSVTLLLAPQMYRLLKWQCRLLGDCAIAYRVGQNLNETLKKVLKWGVIYHCAHTKKCIVTIFFYPSRPYKESLSKRRVY